MRIRFPKQYTVLIAKTGRAPVTLTIHPLTIATVAVILAGLPLSWIGSLLHSNIRLSRHNQELVNTASEVLSDLDTLDAEIDSLKKRAGLDEMNKQAERDRDRSEAGGVDAPPRGGPASAIEAEALFNLARRRMPNLRISLEGRVRPALEKTLFEEARREAAFPSSKPLASPLDVSSEFGLRINPFRGRGYEMHDGIDFRGPIGEPIYATADGIVKKAQSGNGYGKHVIIDHGYDYETLYAHMSELVVEEDERIKRGDLIGYVGNTGRSSGPHLHYGIYRKGQPVNPRYYLKLDDFEE